MAAETVNPGDGAAQFAAYRAEVERRLAQLEAEVRRLRALI